MFVQHFFDVPIDVVRHMVYNITRVKEINKTGGTTMEDKILNTLMQKGFDYQVYGIRTEGRLLNVGDELGVSKEWDFENDREFEDKYYDGICATGFGYLWFDEDDMDEIKKALAINSKYSAEHQYLIGGTSYEYGDDEQEVIVKDAVVLAVLR